MSPAAHSRASRREGASRSTALECADIPPPSPSRLRFRPSRHRSIPCRSARPEAGPCSLPPLRRAVRSVIYVLREGEGGSKESQQRRQPVPALRDGQTAKDKQGRKGSGSPKKAMNVADYRRIPVLRRAVPAWHREALLCDVAPRGAGGPTELGERSSSRGCDWNSTTAKKQLSISTFTNVYQC